MEQAIAPEPMRRRRDSPSQGGARLRPKPKFSMLSLPQAECQLHPHQQAANRMDNPQHSSGRIDQDWVTWMDPTGNIAAASRQQHLYTQDCSKDKARIDPSKKEPDINFKAGIAGDYCTPKGRRPKFGKPQNIFQVEKLGRNATLRQSVIFAKDAATPPKKWWEHSENVGLFKRQEDSVEVSDSDAT